MGWPRSAYTAHPGASATDNTAPVGLETPQPEMDPAGVSAYSAAEANRWFVSNWNQAMKAVASYQELEEGTKARLYNWTQLIFEPEHPNKLALHKRVRASLDAYAKSVDKNPGLTNITPPVKFSESFYEPANKLYFLKAAEIPSQWRDLGRHPSKAKDDLYASKEVGFRQL